MEDDWDLYAVVRSCCTGTITNTTSCDPIFSNFQQDYNFSSSGVQDLFEAKRESSIDEMNNLYKPFFPKAQKNREPVVSPQFSPLSVLGGLQDLSYEQQPQKQPSFSVFNGSKGSHNPISRSKRRKNQMKKVCHVPAESLSSDKWSWRKYGQKPIKGSPYPRGYYRCSTSKGCMARKQVERNRSDPGMFIVTYTAEHNHPMPTHRNSLAGSTRHKPAENPNKPSCSPEMSPAADLSPAPEKLESSRDDLLEPEDEDDDGFSVSNVALDDDFFAGLEDLTGPVDGECFADHFPTRLGLPWLVNSANTTTAGGS